MKIARPPKPAPEPTSSSRSHLPSKGGGLERAKEPQYAAGQSILVGGRNNSGGCQGIEGHPGGHRPGLPRHPTSLPERFQPKPPLKKPDAFEPPRDWKGPMAGASGDSIRNNGRNSNTMAGTGNPNASAATPPEAPGFDISIRCDALATGESIRSGGRGLTLNTQEHHDPSHLRPSRPAPADGWVRAAVEKP